MEMQAMAKLRFEITTGERLVYQDTDVDMVVAPGIEGALGILPQHAPLVTTLQAGELRVKKGAEEHVLVVTGGFMEVTGDRVLILADAAERIEEIDVARADEARRRAQDRLANQGVEDVDLAAAEAALRRSLVRLRIARRWRGAHPGSTT
jgi:F-type H+-transporting ATPase subunit epsilon